jgi:hypothetical protein
MLHLWQVTPAVASGVNVNLLSSVQGEHSSCNDDSNESVVTLSAATGIRDLFDFLFDADEKSQGSCFPY